MIFVSRTLLYIIMDNTTKIREELITQIENYYCQRLTELVDMKMFDDAHAHASMRIFTVDDESCQWFFIKMLKMMIQKLYPLMTNK